MYGNDKGCGLRPSDGDVVLWINNGTAEIDPKDDRALLNKKIPSEIYLVADAKEKLRQSSPIIRALWDYDVLPVQNLQIALLDSENAVLQEETILAAEYFKPYNYTSQGQPRAIPFTTDYTGFSRDWLGAEIAKLPWLMLAGPGKTGPGLGSQIISIFEQRAFDIILAIKPEALAKAKKIRVNLVN